MQVCQMSWTWARGQLLVPDERRRRASEPLTVGCCARSWRVGSKRCRISSSSSGRRASPSLPAAPEGDDEEPEVRSTRLDEAFSMRCGGTRLPDVHVQRPSHQSKAIDSKNQGSAISGGSRLQVLQGRRGGGGADVDVTAVCGDVVEGDPARATVVATHRRHALRRRRDAHALTNERLARHTILQVTSHVCSNDSGGTLLAGARRSIAIEPINGRSFTESPGRTVAGVARGETRGERRRHRSHARGHDVQRRRGV